MKVVSEHDDFPSAGLADAGGPIYWATLSYARWWLAVDAPYLGAVKAASGVLTEEIAEDFLKNYRVRRGFKGSKEGRMGSLVDAANSAASRWPNGLFARYEACKKLAQEWRDSGVNSHEAETVQISAATKIMWLLKPAGWPIFDRFVCIAMNAGSAKGYYSQLASIGFEHVRDAFQEVIDESPWKGMHSAKLIDHFLLVRGSNMKAGEVFQWPAEDIHKTDGFLSVLNSTMKNSLFKLARELECVGHAYTGNEGFLPPKRRYARRGK